MALPRKNGNNEISNNFTATVVDAVGVLILPPVKTFGPRGVTPIWGYDKNGAIVENGWSTKIDLYRIINNVNALKSERIKAIDQRMVSLIADAKNYLLALQNFAKTEQELKNLYAVIPTVFALAGQPSIGKAAGFIGQLQKSDSYEILIQQLQKKLIHFESETKALEVLKKGLTGEYKNFDTVVNTATEKPDTDTEARSSNLTNNWLWVALAVIGIYFFIKRKKT